MSSFNDRCVTKGEALGSPGEPCWSAQRCETGGSFNASTLKTFGDKTELGVRRKVNKEERASCFLKMSELEVGNRMDVNRSHTPGTLYSHTLGDPNNIQQVECERNPFCSLIDPAVP